MKKVRRLVTFMISALLTISIFTANVPVKAAQKIDTTDASLKSLKISGGTLSPVFNKNMEEYIVSVNSNVTYINVTATPSNSHASFKFIVNGTSEIAGISGKSTKIKLEGLKTGIQILVTSQSGNDQKNYKITVNRAEENDASLSKLVVLPSEIEGVVFDKDNKCILNLPFTYSNIKIIPTAADSRAKISINKRVIKSGSQFSTSLKTGENIFEIIVTNGKGNNTYKLIINRSKNDNSSLKTLTISPGVMNIRFSKNITKYNLTLKDTDKKISVIPVAEDNNAKIELALKYEDSTTPINPKGNKYEIGVEEPGTYNIAITVTADDDISKTVYFINITKPDDSDKTLSNILISSGVLDKEFDSNITLYNVIVENYVSRITVEAKPLNTNSSVKISVDGKNAGSGKANISLKEGLNVVKVEVYSHDGSKTPNVYTINIKRVPQPVMQIAEIGYENKILPENRISVKDNTYTIDFTGLKDTDMIKFIKIYTKYISSIKFQNSKEVKLIEGYNILNDLSAVGLIDNGENGVSVGTLKKNADANGYITIHASLMGEYEGHEISKDIVLKARVKEARKESGINNIVSSMKFNLNNDGSINAVIDKNHNRLTFDFGKVDDPQSDLRVINAVINVKRDCILEIGSKSILLTSGDNILTIEDIGFIDNGDDGVSFEFLKLFTNLSQSGTIIDETAKGSPEYLITFAIKW